VTKSLSSYGVTESLNNSTKPCRPSPREDGSVTIEPFGYLK
jgi:hypothetical protein